MTGEALELEVALRAERLGGQELGELVHLAGAERDVDDDAAALLSHRIARDVEKELEYPGQIKVTVIRESRAVDYAK